LCRFGCVGAPRQNKKKTNRLQQEQKETKASSTKKAEKRSVEGGAHHHTDTADPIVRSETHSQNLGQWNEKLRSVRGLMSKF
jgi:iron only hydrogenase large subunit-like protein